MNDFELEDWLPMEPTMGPPLPRFLGIYWPWHKPKIGDLNDNGQLDAADLTILSLYVAGSPIAEISPLSEAEFLRRADINGDGVVNILDVTAMELLLAEAVAIY